MSFPPTAPLHFWRDITPEPHPLHHPTTTSPHVLIIGGGVSGLTTAWCLLDKGYTVTVASKAWANNNERITAQIAGALWEYPPAVCGSHTDETSLAFSKSWVMTAYQIWTAIANMKHLPSGARIIPANFFFLSSIDEDARQLQKMKEIMASGVRGFVHDKGLIKQHGISEQYGAKDAYGHLSIVIDTDQAMDWLMDLCKAKGANFVTEDIPTDLLLLEDELLADHNADVIVNCTGLASRVLANDPSCYPLRGALIRLVNDGRDFPKITSALSISADAAASEENGIVFLVPRNNNILILGGVAQAGKGELNLTLDSPIIKRMRQRCERFLPDLKNAKLDPEYPFAQGLRPARTENVRVERELRPRFNGGGPSRIVHNYGHGGSGWSLSFGCAAEVLTLVDEALEDKLPRSMASVNRMSKMQARL